MEIDKKQLSELVLKYQSGDGKAFEEIYDITNKSAYFTALKITKNEEDAKDVLQEAYVKLLDTINKLEKPESFMNWFNMIVANKAKDFMRKNNPNLFIDNVISSGKDGEEDFSVFDIIEDDNVEFIPGADIEKTELQRDVMVLIDELSDEKRTAILLYYYNEMTTKQIATSLRVNENTVKSRLVQARKELAISVKELEKKNGKLLGIAPIPVVIWALKASSITAGATYVASGAAASAYAAITSTKPVVGVSATTAGVASAATNVATSDVIAATATPIAGTSVTTAATAGSAVAGASTGSMAAVGGAVAGISLAQKIAAIVAATAILVGGSITTKIAIDKKKEKESTAISEEYRSEEAEVVENLNEEITTEISNEIEPDFKRLEEVFPFYNFDRSSKTASYEALYNVIWEFGLTRNYMGENDIKYFFKGDKGYDENVTRWTYCDGYKRYPADKVDAILREAYNVEPTHEKEYKVNGYTFGFYDGEYYYNLIEIMDWLLMPEVVNHVKNSDGTYTITVVLNEEGEPEEECTIIAEPIMINGKSDWRFISVKHKNYSEQVFTATNKASNENNWQNVYKHFLENEIDEGNPDAIFSLIYLDDDNTPELVYSRATEHHARPYIYTFSGGAMVELGQYGNGGRVEYYKKTGIIIDEISGSNSFGGSYDKKQENQMITLDTYDGHFEYDPDTDTAVQVVSINDKEASAEELDALIESYRAKYGEADESGEYKLTRNNIETYCK